MAGWIPIAIGGAFAAATPTLSVDDQTIAAGQFGEVIASGEISGEATFGVTVIVAIVPRAGARGTVTFTPSPPVDIAQLNDPWPDAGTFNAFDTDLTGSLTLNGAVDDNGVFLAQPVTFSGPLCSFPVQASLGAQGIWDVTLTTQAGDSGWGGLATALMPGTITVMGSRPIPTASGWGLVVLAALLLVVGGALIAHPRRAQPTMRNAGASRDAVVPRSALRRSLSRRCEGS